LKVSKKKHVQVADEVAEFAAQLVDMAAAAVVAVGALVKCPTNKVETFDVIINFIFISPIVQ